MSTNSTKGDDDPLDTDLKYSTDFIMRISCMNLDLGEEELPYKD